MRFRKSTTVVLLLFLSGCSSAGYYSQSIRGQLSILVKRRSFEDVLADPQVDGVVRDKLARVAQIRDFATRELALPDSGSYRTYVELDRDYVVWNVVAAPEFSVEAQTWCFPVAGCVAYRGYFSHKNAEAFAARLAEQGHDTTVDGVAAYSTLGWFRDPVLSTVIHRSESSLAALLFHELAHEKVYVKDDSVFNESYATAVELAGLDRFLDAEASAAAQKASRVRRDRREQFGRLVDDCRRELATIYGDEALSDGDKRAAKAAAFAGLRAAYQIEKKSWDGYTGYDSWFAKELNNAHLASVGTYSTLVPEFQRLLSGVDDDLEAFHELVAEIGDLSFEERRARLALTAPRSAHGSR